MTRKVPKLGFVAAMAAVAAITLVGCSGGSGSSGALNEAACNALISNAKAPSASAAGSTSTLASAKTATAQPATVEPASAVTKAPASAATGVKTADPAKTITFVGGAYTDTTQTWWKNLATKFEAANPGYTVNVNVIDWNNIDQQVATMIQTKQYPDVLNENKYSTWADKDLLQDASSLVSPSVNSDFIPAFKEAGTFKGTQYGLPFITSTRALFYNKAAFKKADIAGPPNTWKELIADAQKLKKAGYTGYGLPLGTEEAQAEWSIWMWGNGGDWESGTGKFTIDSAQNEKTLKVLNCMANVWKITESNPGQTNRTDGVFRSFANGKVGMMMGASFAPSLFKGWKSTVDYGVAPVPVNGNVKRFTLGVQDYLMSFKNPGNQEAVSKFLNFFYQKDNYVDFLTSQGFLPATKTASTALESNKDFGPFLSLLPTAKFYPSTDPGFPTVQGAVQNQIGTGVQPNANVKSILTAINNSSKQK